GDLRSCLFLVQFFSLRVVVSEAEQVELSVSLAGLDGCVLGGGVAGLLTAASPVQIIIGSFLAEGWKESRSGMQPEPLSSSMPKFIPGASAVGSPPSRGNLSE
ncbi:hypothetical protein CUMW_082340, partial [Citrus unshiu]